jgi:hypothetical protein
MTSRSISMLVAVFSFSATGLLADYPGDAKREERMTTSGGRQKRRATHSP